MMLLDCAEYIPKTLEVFTDNRDLALGSSLAVQRHEVLFIRAPKYLPVTTT